jgi:hypothetical protein
MHEFLEYSMETLAMNIVLPSRKKSVLMTPPKNG